jgi:hypothetical protein
MILTSIEHGLDTRIHWKSLATDTGSFDEFQAGSRVTVFGN